MPSRASRGSGGDPERGVARAGGQRLHACYAAAPWTTPSFASILTPRIPRRPGRTPRSRARLQVRPDRLASDAGGVLREHGYWTGRRSAMPISRGAWARARFDDYENLVSIQWQHPVLAGLGARGLIAIRPTCRRRADPPHPRARAPRRARGALLRAGPLHGSARGHLRACRCDQRTDPSYAQRYRDEVAYTDLTSDLDE